jgi:hypothetical protein
MRRVSASPRFVILASTGLVALALCLLTTAVPASAQSDLDALMERVLARRDENWKKLQQYVLDEREDLQIDGPAPTRLFGFRREYLWFPRDGRFIRSPVSADGVAIPEDERRREEARWVQREERREKRRQQEAGPAATRNEGESGDPSRTYITIGPGGIRIGRGDPEAASEPSMRDALEPGFVSAAYFLNFKFDRGQYALVGREQYEGRDVLRIEYYPTLMFKEGRTRPNRELRQRDQDVERRMNKVSLVTLWVDPAQHQIVRYEFENMDMDFLPGTWLIRPDGWQATMEMSQPFSVSPDLSAASLENVWLPRSIRFGFDVTLAVGTVQGRYSTEYRDYRLADVALRVR